MSKAQSWTAKNKRKKECLRLIRLTKARRRRKVLIKDCASREAVNLISIRFIGEVLSQKFLYSLFSTVRLFNLLFFYIFLLEIVRTGKKRI
jgi:hypothetical protein